MDTIKKLVKKIFQYEARLVLLRYKPKIIAITGSVGKTTTKEALYTVLSKKYFVRKSEKSFTTELGLPLAILGCSQGTGGILQWLKNIFIGLGQLIHVPHYPDWLILEIDGDKPGDFSRLSTWLKPNIIVVTAIGDVPAHVEFFGSVENLLREKQVLLDSLGRDGVIVYNADDARTSELVATSEVRKISCGINSNCDVSGKEFTILYGGSGGMRVPTGMSFGIETEHGLQTITRFQTLGIHNEYASLLTYAVAKELGMSSKDCITQLNKNIYLPGRMTIVSGIQDTVIIDDSYNSSPLALRESLQTFENIGTPARKIVVIGDMYELGRYSSTEHKKVAQQIKGFVTFVFCVGIRTRTIAEELLDLGFDESRIQTVNTAGEAGALLKTVIQSGDLIFVKGSQVMRMEKVVEEVMRHPEDKATLLVRQEPEWLSRP